MKKIAVLLFEMRNNLGGILPSTINLCKGFEELGYQVTVFHAEWKGRIYSSRGPYKEVGYGLRVADQGDRVRLFADPAHACLYKGSKAAYELQERLSEHDAVILSTSVPSMGSKEMRDNHDWPIVLRHGKPMISIVRDCHWDKLSLHILPYRHLFMAFMGVHPAAFKSLQTMPWKIGCQVNPHNIELHNRDYEKHWDEVCITSWFKAWKHIDDIVRAVPYMKPVELTISGGGIEHSYMLAARDNPDRTDKGESYYRKIEEYMWKKGDVDVKNSWKRKSIWGVAEESGNFSYQGFLLGKKLDRLQSRSGGLIDPSYHYKWGEHFNRTLIEAIIHHSIPFARPYGISDNRKGRGTIFGPENIVLIPEDASPRSVGEIIRSSMNDRQLRKDILAANAKKLKMFQRDKVAAEYIKILKGKSGGIVEMSEGKLSEKIIARMEKAGIRIRFPRG